MSNEHGFRRVKSCYAAVSIIATSSTATAINMLQQAHCPNPIYNQYLKVQAFTYSTTYWCRYRDSSWTNRAIIIQATTSLYLTAPALEIHHPFHLHGYDFFVMAMDQFPPGENLDSISKKLLDSNFRRSSLPARKDTIAVPSNGYAAVRFKADNPGEKHQYPYWKIRLRLDRCVCVCDTKNRFGHTGNWAPGI